MIDLRLGNCLEILPTLADKSVDAVITDPPYGIGLAEWDSVQNITWLMTQFQRISREFVAFWGQFPSLIDWYVAAKSTGLHYLENVVWVKRMAMPSARLSRTYECIGIFATNGKRQFHQTKGKYQDVKVPGVLVDRVTLDGVMRYISELHLTIKRGGARTIQKHTSCQSEFSRYNFPSVQGQEMCNFTNVWSFLPPSRKVCDGKYNHPAEKPIDAMNRLCEMLSVPGGAVLDPFMGSGTTGVACVKTGRSFIGIEIDPTYFAIAQKRIAEAQAQLPLMAGGYGK